MVHFFFFTSILLLDIPVWTNMHTLELNALIIAKVWLRFILGFNPNLSVAFITPYDLLLLKLHPDPELQKQDIIL